MKSTTIILNANNLSDNVNYYYKTYNKKIMAVIKNNAYGHGMKEISKLLDNNELINYFVVNTLKEALSLRKFKIKKNILILGNIEPKDYPLTLKNNLTISLNSLKMFYELIYHNYQGKIHVNINTGMNRLGINNFDIRKILDSNLNIEGIYTHYIGGDKDYYTIKKQQQAFINEIKKINYQKYLIHDVSSSSVSLLDLSYTNAIRIGLGLYGLNYITKPILKIESPIINIIKIKKGESVSYHSSFIAPENGYILTIPFGYGDGFYKNIEIINKDYLQAGDMTMNYTMFYSKNYPTKSTIEIIGNQNKILNMSLIHNLSPYEITTKLSPFIHRTISQK